MLRCFLGYSALPCDLWTLCTARSSFGSWSKLQEVDLFNKMRQVLAKGKHQASCRGRSYSEPLCVSYQTDHSSLFLCLLYYCTIILYYIVLLALPKRRDSVVPSSIAILQSSSASWHEGSWGWPCRWKITAVSEMYLAQCAGTTMESFCLGYLGYLRVCVCYSLQKPSSSTLGCPEQSVLWSRGNCTPGAGMGISYSITVPHRNSLYAKRIP